MSTKPVIPPGLYKTSSGGGGDMLKSVYDPANIASQVAGTTVANSFLADQTFTTNIKLGAGGDVILNRKAAATLQLGVDAAGVTNQVITAANRITSDGVGANLTIAPGNGRGGAAGSLIFSTYTTAGAGVAGTLTTQLTLTIGQLQFAESVNMAFGDSFGTKIGTVANQLLGFWGATPVDQPAFIADPTGGSTEDVEARASIVSILDLLIETGFMASS